MYEQKSILKFPRGFLWGASTSAYQIEGGNINDWSEWEKSEARIKKLKAAGKNPEDFICGQACDSYNKYEEDLDLVKNLNCGAYRLGIEWSRIEPTVGQWNMAEVEHYRKVLLELKKRGLKSVVTLWHWTNPIWLAQVGGWSNKKSINYFLRYSEFIVKELGDLIDYWITLNEPMAHIGFGYIKGNYPPGRRGDLIGVIKVFKNFSQAHMEAYKKIHELRPDAKVSFTSLTDYFEPANRLNPFDILINSIVRYFHHRWFLNKVKSYLDFIAFDYYFHNRTSCLPPFKVNLNKEVSDLGWEIYPEGIYWVIKYLRRFKKPIYIMENGIADRDDDQRPEFIARHLKYVHRAISEGIDVQGYFYWSLLDNFEWADGWKPKFGLYAVNRKTFNRTPRPSAAKYAETCKNNGIEKEA